MTEKQPEPEQETRIDDISLRPGTLLRIAQEHYLLADDTPGTCTGFGVVYTGTARIREGERKIRRIVRDGCGPKTDLDAALAYADRVIAEGVERTGSLEDFIRELREEIKSTSTHPATQQQLPPPSLETSLEPTIDEPKRKQRGIGGYILRILRQDQ